MEFYAFNMMESQWDYSWILSSDFAGRSVSRLEQEENKWEKNKEKYMYV